jgi:hypothetical protein
MKTCRHCGEPSQTATRRPGSYTVLCAECHLDHVRAVKVVLDLKPDVRVVFPKETGVLKYQPFKRSLQGGGS